MATIPIPTLDRLPHREIPAFRSPGTYAGCLPRWHLPSDARGGSGESHGLLRRFSAWSPFPIIPLADGICNVPRVSLNIWIS